MRQALLGVFLLAGSSAHAADEVHVYGIANFGGDGECGSTSQTHSVHTETAAAFRDVFDLLRMLGAWDDTATRNNKNARRRYFEDGASDTVENRGVDDADVIFVHTHGSRSVSYNRSSLSMGNASDGCSARTDSHMFFNSDLDIAVIKACQSGDYEVWQQGGYYDMLPTTTTFSTWNAFHGDSSCGSHVTSYVADYAWLSLEDGVGENWIDVAFDEDDSDDDCPVSIVFGSMKMTRHMMYEYGGFLDRKNTGQKSGSTIFYVGGCNPENGIRLPE